MMCDRTAASREILRERKDVTRRVLIFAPAAVLVALAGSRVSRASGVVSTCDESHLRAAISGGGSVTFACSGTITLASTVNVTNDTSMDGAGQKVTISGGGSVGVLSVTSGITLTVNELTIANGKTAGPGGGIYNHAGMLRVTYSTFSGNSNDGIYNENGALILINSTFSENSTSAIYNNAGTLRVVLGTFSGNGTGIDNANGGKATIQGAILANNTGGDCSGGVTDGGFNLDDDGTCGLTGSSFSNNKNANLGALSDNGGPTETIPLLPGSSAIGHGGCPIGFDQRGIARPASLNGNCSIGAYEFVPAPTSIISDCSSDTRLQAAVQTGGRIAFNCSGDIKLTGTLAIYGNNTSIDGTGQNVTLDGQGFFPAIGTLGNIVTLSTLTIANSNIYNQADLTVTNSTFSSSNIQNGNFQEGSTSTLIVLNSTFSASGIVNSDSSLQIFNSTFSGGGVLSNQDSFMGVTNSTFFGIGIQNLTPSTSFTASDLTIINSTFSGGGISNGQGLAQVTLANTIVANSYPNCETAGPSIIDGGYNLDDDGSCGFSSSNHSFSNNKNANLGALSNNGGPTQTIPLLPGSVAIDQIPIGTSGCGALSSASGTIILTDQRGVIRPLGPACDIGAFETTRQPVAVAFNTSPGGLSYTVDGTTYTSPQTLTLGVGSQHTISTITPQGSNGTRYIFTNWSNGPTPTSASQIITISSATTSYIAAFSTAYLLSTAANPPVGGTVTPPSGSYYAAGTQVGLTATPNSGYVFLGWTGNVANSNSASTTVIMNQPQSVTANFAQTLISGNGCNGVYGGTFKGNVTVSNGQNCRFVKETIIGNVTENGGSLALTNTSVGGNAQINGGTFSIGPSTVIKGNLQIQNMPSGSATNQVCGSNIDGNLQFQNNGTPVNIGGVSGSSCGNTITGNLQVTNNSAATTVDGNSVGNDLQDNNNSAATRVFGNTVANNLQCQQNTSITGGQNTAKQKQGQCSAF